MEKITESLKLHLPEAMKRDIQDAAMADDRKVSDWIRHVLALHLYGRIGADGSSTDQCRCCRNGANSAGASL